ncbi:MAG: hypothetical protein ACD_49C00023G0002 [uncultured bacterium (gcode 4)]|uniref:Uncharacterized protein n=1 Tax=uncultured bacterium (gcode 4) TaxID=1234023 RepID=K2BWX7_9BACT|nr:MAG: hypothetical protein ACD_49C00023G0002 [uncultured bacterium (gcode 4)]
MLHLTQTIQSELGDKIACSRFAIRVEIWDFIQFRVASGKLDELILLSKTSFESWSKILKFSRVSRAFCRAKTILFSGIFDFQEMFVW